MAPEILGKGGHSFPVDWWALGTIAFEMLYGEAPFFQQNQEKMFKAIQKSGVKFPDKVKISKDCKSFIKSLLHKDPKKRLGAKGGFTEVM